MRTALLLLTALGASQGSAATAADPAATRQGRDIAFDAERGNCLACHVMADGRPAGNVGPPLVNLAARYGSREALRAQVWDARQARPDSLMPPFGRNGLLSETEIDRLVDYLWTL
jgi:L-cysteine S-thiosulfotransferase